jgi:hypothetical protein
MFYAGLVYQDACMRVKSDSMRIHLYAMQQAKSLPFLQVTDSCMGCN